MRRLIFFVTGALVAGTISDTERKLLLDHLAQSQKTFEQAIRGLTPEQARFKAAPDKWSVLDCAEHLTKAESFLFGRVQDGLKAGQAGKSRPSDADVLDGWGTRKQKVKAPPVITPTGEWPDLAAIQKEFTARRARTIHFVETTQADLRGLTCCGGMDLYQQLLGLSAHTLRHVDQMNEVKADPNYPKAAAKTISDTERKQLLDHLEQSKSTFDAAIRRLTPLQAKFKPGPDRWSVMECAEHLTQAERLLFTDVQDALKGPVGVKSLTSDASVLEVWGTRKQKAKSSGDYDPIGRWPDLAAIQREFAQRRAITVHFVETTQEDLRGRTCCGGMDLYQQLLGISAHTLRHVEQMNEVKAEPNYPKS